MTKKIVFQIIVLFITACSVVAANTPHIDLGTGSGTKGVTVQIPVTLTNVSGTKVSAIGMDISYDTNVLENPAATLGPAGSAAGKSIHTSTPSPGVFRIGIVGFNNTAIGDGIVAYVTLTIKSTANSGSTTLANTPSASDPEGYAVVVSGSNGSLNVEEHGPDIMGGWKEISSRKNGKWIFGKFRIENVGDQDTGKFKVAFYLSNDTESLGKLLKNITLSKGLKSGNAKTLSLKYTSKTSLSGMYIIAVIDSKNQIDETNESDNEISNKIP